MHDPDAHADPPGLAIALTCPTFALVLRSAVAVALGHSVAHFVCYLVPYRLAVPLCIAFDDQLALVYSLANSHYNAVTVTVARPPVALRDALPFVDNPPDNDVPPRTRHCAWHNSVQLLQAGRNCP